LIDSQKQSLATKDQTLKVKETELASLRASEQKFKVDAMELQTKLASSEAVVTDQAREIASMKEQMSTQ
jgi:hypothetical protein